MASALSKESAWTKSSYSESMVWFTSQSPDSVHQRQVLPLSLHCARLLVLLANAGGSPKTPPPAPRRAPLPFLRPPESSSSRRAGSPGRVHGAAVHLPPLRRRRHRYEPSLPVPASSPILPLSLLSGLTVGGCAVRSCLQARRLS
jgi:hypothetical protein